MDEITKIDRDTGDIIWRFGVNSLNNMFTFTNDSIGFSHQHDCRWIENGNLTLYDNGNLHSPSFSQSVEYSVDEGNLTATLVWNYINDQVIYGSAMGSSDRLPGGNTLICWGNTNPIHISEVTYSKNKALEMRFPSGVTL